MVNRPVFVTLENRPYFKEISVEFEWHIDLELEKPEHQKNIFGLHTAFNSEFPHKKVLEISTKSSQPLGVELSAFNLKKFVSSLGKSISVECIYQGGKVFEGGGPYLDMYEKTAKEAKLDQRLQTSGKINGYYFEGKEYPVLPKTAFFDWLYIKALQENPHLAKELVEYDAFTDIAFDPKTGVNCQARASAIFVGLSRTNSLHLADSFESFVKLYE